MPYDLYDHIDQRLTTLRFRGFVSVSELSEALRRLYRRRAATRGLGELLDLRQVTGMEARYPDFLILVSEESMLDPDELPRRAILAVTDVQKEAAQVLERLTNACSGSRAQVSDHPDHAAAWLGLTTLPRLSAEV